MVMVLLQPGHGGPDVGAVDDSAQTAAVTGPARRLGDWQHRAV
jgi:N-acetylmuramoyl-L-alanine amidase